MKQKQTRSPHCITFFAVLLKISMIRFQLALMELAVRR
jgi:hypothetical protein